MATNIPPHNLGEVIDATLHLIDHPDATVDDLMQFVKGPDFPTGGQIMGRAGILDAYRTGRGSVRCAPRPRSSRAPRRADRRERDPVPDLGAGHRAEGGRAGERREIEGIRAIKNESAKGKIQLVFELKKDAPALVILNNLYKHTPMQTSFPVNMVALVDSVPRTLSLRDALHHYVEHQREIIRRRSEYRLAKAQRDAHVREGFSRPSTSSTRSSPRSERAMTVPRRPRRSWPLRSSSPTSRPSRSST
jgi:DNA gyrase subunit A